jgi:hypothetical protein
MITGRDDIFKLWRRRWEKQRKVLEITGSQGGCTKRRSSAG